LEVKEVTLPMFSTTRSLFAGPVALATACVALFLTAPSRAQSNPQSVDPATVTRDSQFSGSSAALPSSLDLQSGSADADSSTRNNLGSMNSASSLLSPQGQDGAPGLVSPYFALPAEQILRILESQPSLTVELKSAVADRLTASGVPTDANTFTDEQFYAQITNSPVLRTEITTYLRARGYISSEDLAAAALNSPSSSRQDTMSAAGFASQGMGAPESFSATRDQSPQLSMRQPRTTTERMQPTRSTTDEPAVLHAQTPYNLQSLRDLYAQLPEDNKPLRRFGSEFFASASSSMTRGSSDAPLDVPLGPDYVVGAGDALTINIWGGTTQTFSRAVSRDGTLLLPEAGSLQVAGLTLGRVETLVQSAISRQFRDVRSSVTVSRLRSVRVYVAGDVVRPGGYDLSPLATPLSALYIAGGPTAAGSLRIVRHLRGAQLVEQIDLYDFLLHGVRASAGNFESGDTLIVPPAGPQIALGGSVRRPAIYELTTADLNLEAVIEDAGGLLPAAAADRIRVERIELNAGRRTFTAPHAASPDADRSARSAFAVQDGDRILVGSLLPYSERVVYLAGHVARPGRLAYRDGMRLSDVLRSQADLLPEPDARGEIVRLVPPDLHADTLAFNLREVIAGKENLSLEPFDTIRIFGRYERDSPSVTVTGEVQRPGPYPLSDGMTAGQLVRMAGGFKRAALRDTADLTSYTISGGERVKGSLASVRIAAAVNGNDPQADVVLKPGDVLTIREITGWGDIGQSVTIDGQVRFPGTYGFREGEKLSTVLQRAGGMRDTAYPEGAVLVREQVKDLEQKSRDELVRQIQTNAASSRISPNLAASGEASSALQAIKAQQDEVLADLKSHPPVGRMVIRISGDISQWANTTDDIELRRGDVLTIPKKPGFVLVTGQVFNGTALTFTPGKTAAWYLARAGGSSQSADRKDIFVIRANGTVVGRHSGGGWFTAAVLSTHMEPGDVVVVPQKIIGASLFWRNLLTAAQLASSIAITAAVGGL
jgi:protein involved in polysaccharide export with SLBB domain